MTVQLSALRVSSDLDATKYVSGAQQIQAANRGMANTSREVGAAVTQTDTKLSQSGDAVARLSRQYVDGYANAARFNAALNGLSNQVSRGNVEMVQAMAILDGIYRKHGIVGDSARFAARGQMEFAAAIDRANAKLLQQQNIVPDNQNVVGGTMTQWRRQNLGYQIFDIGQTAALGMNPAMILAQQGPQIVQLYAGQGGVNAALKDMAVLASGAVRALGPIAVAAGLGALAIKDMKSQIEEATGKTVTFGETFSAVVSVITDDIKALISPLTEAVGPTFVYVFKQLGSAAVDIAELVVNSFRAAFYDIKTLWDLFPDMMEASITGGVNALIDGLNAMMRVTANGIDALLAKINEIAGSEYEMIGDRLALPKIPNDAADRLRQGLDQREDEIARIMRSTPLRDYYGDVTRRAGDIADRNNPQIMNSDGRMTFVPIPNARPNIEMEGLPGQTRSAADAYRDLIKSANDRVEQMQLEARVSGHTGIAAERLRFELELLQRAQDKGRDITPEQRQEIERLGAAFEVAARQAASFKLQADAEFERQQLGRNEIERNIASQLRSSGLPVDLDSYEAGILRANEALRRQVDAWEAVRDTGRDAIDELVGSAISGFDDIEDALKNIAQSLVKQLTELGIGNPLKNALYGDNLPTMETVGGLGGFFSALAGGRSPAATSTAAMTVNAATVTINGGLAGGIGNPFAANDNFRPNTTLGDLLGRGGAANDNVNLSGSGAGLAWNFWKSKGLADHQVAGILGNIKAESAFNPLAVGDGGNAFGLYQHNDRRFRLFDAIGGKANLSDALAQHRFAYSELMGPESRAWAALKNSTDVRSATAAFAGFERPSGFSWANPEGAHNFVGRLNGANEALAKFGGTAGSATNMLGTFGTGLDKFGNALSSVNLGGGAGGGGFNWGSLFSGFTPNTTLGSFLINGFADGTEWTRGGLAMVGERGREIVRLPRGSQVVSNHRTESLAAAGRNEVSQGGGFSQVINNYSGEPVKTEERPDGRGGRRQIVTIGSVVAEAMGTPGSPLARQMEQQFGVKRRMNNKWQ